MTTPALPPTDREIGRPDWVMVGVPADGGFAVWASRSLSRAEVTQVIDQRRSTFGPVIMSRPASRRFEITVTAGDLVVGYGGSYGEALRVVLESWSPDPPARPLPSPTPPALKPGTS